MARRKSIKRIANEANDWLYLLTGSRARTISMRAYDHLIRPRIEKALEERPDPDPRYAVLEVTEGCHPETLKAAYRSQMKRFHPDGTAPDEEMAKVINNAYESICKERELPK